MLHITPKTDGVAFPGLSPPRSLPAANTPCHPEIHTPVGHAGQLLQDAALRSFEIDWSPPDPVFKPGLQCEEVFDYE